MQALMMRMTAHLEVVLLCVPAHEHVEGGIHIGRLASCRCIDVQLVLCGVQRQHVRPSEPCTATGHSAVKLYTPPTSVGTLEDLSTWSYRRKLPGRGCLAEQNTHFSHLGEPKLRKQASWVCKAATARSSPFGGFLSSILTRPVKSFMSPPSSSRTSTTSAPRTASRPAEDTNTTTPKSKSTKHTHHQQRRPARPSSCLTLPAAVNAAQACNNTADHRSKTS
jgi:hypothetical protein